MSKYEIKTTKDILDAVTPENVEGFLKDFSAWVKLNIQAKDLFGDALADSTFTWNDDGDYGTIKGVNIEIRLKKLDKQTL